MHCDHSLPLTLCPHLYHHPICLCLYGKWGEFYLWKEINHLRGFTCRHETNSWESRSYQSLAKGHLLKGLVRNTSSHPNRYAISYAIRVVYVCIFKLLGIKESEWFECFFKVRYLSSRKKLLLHDDKHPVWFCSCSNTMRANLVKYSLVGHTPPLVYKPSYVSLHLQETNQFRDSIRFQTFARVTLSHGGNCLR